MLQRVANDDKAVFDGDIGRITAIDPEQSTLTATFDGRAVAYGFGDLEELAPASAAGIQTFGLGGSGGGHPAGDAARPAVGAQPAYTAGTRGRKLVVLVAEPKALRMAVKRQVSQRRVTRLRKRLREGVAVSIG